MRSPVSIFSKFWTGKSGLGALLALLIVVIFVVYPLAPAGGVHPVFSLLYSLLLLSGVAATGGTYRNAGWVGAALALGWIAVEAVILVRPGPRMLILEAGVAVLALTFLEFTLLFQVFMPGRINKERIGGAIAAYLLIGLSWSWIYRLMLLQNPAAIASANDPSHSLAHGTNLLYFSFTTLATVGYGDVVPVAPFARSFANLEALIGILYPAILIGRLVSLGFHDTRLEEP